MPFAVDGLAWTLLALALHGPSSHFLGNQVGMRPGPLLAVAALQAAIACKRGDSWRGALAGALLIAATTGAMGCIGLESHRLVVGYHLGLATAIIVGNLLDDPLARFLRQGAAWMIAISCLATTWIQPGSWPVSSPDWIRAYPLVMVVTAIAIHRASGWVAYRNAASLGMALWVSGCGWRSYCNLRRIAPGLDRISLGLASFALAASISLLKTGMLSEWLPGFRTRLITGKDDEVE